MAKNAKAAAKAAKAAKETEAALATVPESDPNSGVWVHGDCEVPSDKPADRLDLKATRAKAPRQHEVSFAAQIGRKCVYAGYSHGAPYQGACWMDELPVAGVSVGEFLQGRLDESRRASIKDTARLTIAL